MEKNFTVINNDTVLETSQINNDLELNQNQINNDTIFDLNQIDNHVDVDINTDFLAAGSKVKVGELKNITMGDLKTMKISVLLYFMNK